MKIFHPDHIEFCESLNPFLGFRQTGKLAYDNLFKMFCGFFHVVSTGVIYPPPQIKHISFAVRKVEWLTNFLKLLGLFSHPTSSPCGKNNCFLCLPANYRKYKMEGICTFTELFCWFITSNWQLCGLRSSCQKIGDFSSSKITGTQNNFLRANLPQFTLKEQSPKKIWNSVLFKFF